MTQLSTPHLLGIKDLTIKDIQLVFETADHFKEVLSRSIKKVPSLRDITIANIFLRIQPALDFLLNWLKSDFLPIRLVFLPPLLLSKKARHCWILSIIS